LAAIACDNKVVSSAEIEVLMDFARATTSPALVGALIFHALEEKADLDDALDALSDSVADLTPEQREAALTSAKPVLALQGARTRPIAERLLRAVAAPPMARDLPEGTNWGLVDDLFDTARRLLKGSDLADAVIECSRSMGNLALADDYRAYRKGILTQEMLFERVREVEAQIASLMTDSENAPTLAKAAEASAAALAATATELRNQVNQRLALVDARIAFASTSFAEDIDDIVHDAGNSIERGISDRLITDDWKKAQVWESIARTQFGQDAERRIGRCLRRMDQELRLLYEDLRLFQAQIGIAHHALYGIEHHFHLGVLMPPLRLGTRAINTINSLANVTLGTGTVAVAGTGTAAYLLGPAVILPLILPALPYVGVPLVVALLFKWLKTPDARRKYAEIRNKRRAFEKLIRDRLLEAKAQQDNQLEKIRNDFAAAAYNLLTPIVLEAEAAQRLPRLRNPLVDQALARTNASIKQLTAQLEATVVP
jgi:hypothetical protein